MDEIKVYNYEGTPVSFSKGEGVMVNATQMAKPFGKRTSDWLSTNQSKEYINVLASTRKTVLADLVRVTNGGSNPGTWMHEDVAMEFARWLSPAFAIWCNDRIKELLTEGVTTITDDDAMIMHSMQVLQRRLEAKEQERKALADKVEADAPKVLFAEALSASKESILIGELAKFLTQNGVKIGQNRLFVLLRDEEYLQRSKGSRYNVPTQRAMEMGLFELKKTVISLPDREPITRITPKVTPKGQQYFLRHYLKRDKLIERE